MMRKIEHIGIAVKDIAASNKIFEDVLGVSPYKQEEVSSEHVLTSFFQVGESKIELLQATHADSAIAKFLEKNREGIHHIAFDVEDITNASTMPSKINLRSGMRDMPRWDGSPNSELPLASNMICSQKYRRTCVMS